MPPPSESSDTTPELGLTPETYFSVGKVVNYGGTGVYDQGNATFDYPATLRDDTFALRGPWMLDYQGATAASDTSEIELNYRAQNVYLVVGGTGTVSLTRAGTTTQIPVSGPPTLRQVVTGDRVARGALQVQLSKKLQAFSLTDG